MKITFTNPYLSLVNEYLIDSPLPANISYFYNFGSLLAANLAILIITGVSLAMHYNSTLSGAFSSVEHISRDVHFGWALRFIHMNTVSFFFLCAYLHIARGLFFSSYKSPRTTLWLVGVLIFFLMMATAFIGYVLPWSSMSFWGATVICNLFSAFPWFGPDLVSFIWGGGSVDGPTLNRFFALHYLLPFLLSALILLHLLALHLPGSTNPEGLPSHTDRIRFHPYFTTKDLVGLFWLLLFLSYFVFFDPHALGHPDASVPANPLVTPASIVPEWYFLPFYAILRAIPNKLLGVLAMFSSIAILIPLSLFSTLNLLSLRYRPLLQFFFWIFSFNFLFLILLGAKPICEPFTTLGQISTFIYFSYFFLLLLLG
jgi:ubiquinol-cytochrome c reductase cytochrome b subunit